MPTLALPRRLPLGLVYIAGSALFFSLMSLCVKLVGARVPTMEVVFVRSVLMTAATWGLLRREGRSALGVDRPLLFARGAIGVAALSLFYFALSRMPLGDATAIFYMTPIWTALIAVVVLKERTARLVFAGMAVSLVGVALIGKPTFLFGGAAGALAPLAVAAVFTASVLSGSVYVLVRKLRVTDAPLVIIFWLSAVGIVGAAPFALGGWVLPTPVEWLYLLGVGVTTLIAQIFLTKGLHLEQAGRAMSIGYLQVVFAFVWGALVFGTLPDWWSLMGAVAIVGSVLLIARQRRV
ncbi:MAG: DMT family transporter [Rhodothermaceae bacterium]|nr:DMT family transporter [Rhodothermaceae bacterium]